MSELYKRIKIRREELGLSQDELAKKLLPKSNLEKMTYLKLKLKLLQMP
jgi:ribosome-binding protein aMBF1 (putative translation factor)